MSIPFYLHLYTGPRHLSDTSSHGSGHDPELLP